MTPIHSLGFFFSSCLHLGFQVSQQHLCLVIILPNDDRLSQLAQYRHRHGVLNLQVYLGPASFSLEIPGKSVFNAALTLGGNPLVGDKPNSI